MGGGQSKKKKKEPPTKTVFGFSPAYPNPNPHTQPVKFVSPLGTLIPYLNQATLGCAGSGLAP
jgi:hypothetical protein